MSRSRSDIKQLLVEHPDGLKYGELMDQWPDIELLSQLISMSLLGEVIYVDGRYRLSFEEWVEAVAS